MLSVEGQTRVSVVIENLNQSTGSHAPLYVGSGSWLADEEAQARSFLEARILKGVRLVSVNEFASCIAARVAPLA